MMVDAVAIPPRVEQQDLDDLSARVRATRRVSDPWRGRLDRGFGPHELQPLLDRWLGGFDWRTQERRIRALPWVIAGDLRVVHQRAADPDAPVVVLLHGWPDSVLRFERVLPLLGDVHVVVPALPGFPFSLNLHAPVSVEDMAGFVIRALAALGYDRVVLSGGDVGGTVAEIIAAARSDLVGAMHLTEVSARHALTVDPNRLAPEARSYLQTTGAWFRTSGGYIAEQSTRPRTLLSGLGDTPAGLAAWLLEKVVDWSDDVTASFSMDELLTWVSAYWFSGTIGTSLSTYVETATVPDRTAVPTVLSAFPADIKPAPQAYDEAFVDLRTFLQHEAGGHFGAWEQPEAYVSGLRTAIALARE